MWIQVEDVDLKKLVLVNTDKVSLIMPNAEEDYVDIVLDDDTHVFAKSTYTNDRNRPCSTYVALWALLTKTDTRFC